MENQRLQIFRDLETSLHRKEVRNSPQQVSDLLADDFIEIGKSGNIYDKESTIADLKNETDDLQIEVSDFFARELSADVVLVTYTSASPNSSGETVYVLRSSIWVKRGEHWQMTFHQGTKKFSNL